MCKGRFCSAERFLTRGIPIGFDRDFDMVNFLSTLVYCYRGGRGVGKL
jgi:hypothetical protein